DYTIGNPSIPTPDKVTQSIKDILDDTDSIKIHGYSMAAGFEETRKAIADNLNERFGTDYKASNLFVTCGAAPALIAIIKGLAVENTEIMAIAPFFPEYRPFVEKNGAKLVVVPADREHFQIDLGKVEALISENTQAIIINSPNNPSGVVYTEETLQALADILTKKSEEYGHPIYIIADEPYRELVYGGVKVPFIPNIYKNTILCYSWYKSLSLPGERIGYFLVPDACDDAQEVYLAISGAARINGHVCAPTLAQMVIERCVSEMPDLQAYDDNRTLLYDSLTAMGYKCAKPDGAFYLFVEVPGGDDFGFCEKAKNEHNLLVVPGTGFDCPGFIRLSYCVSNAMIKRSLPAFEKMIADVK
ncbi:MAG: pyridoxal phosphate-dependent aminotransferase, partial [Firmicutes bacterium]|nr:pyridoxal phosphate-dependent aminotransferase [Bacillota bacterium]